MTAVALARAGSLIGVIADVLLLYSASGGYLHGEYAFLAQVSRGRLLWGHYLGILSVPLEAAAIPLVWRILAPAGPRAQRVTAGLGVYVTCLGVAYHATLYALGTSATHAPEAVDRLRAFSEPLGVLFAGGFFLGMLALAMAVVAGRTRLPRPVALASPVVTYPLWLLAYVAIPPIGRVLLPTGFNLSLGIFIAAIWVTRRALAEDEG